MRSELLLFEAPAAIDEIAAAPDGKVWLAVVAQESGMRAFWNGGDAGSFQSVSNLLVSPDGQHAAFKAEDGRRQFMVLDGRPQEQFVEVDSAFFTPKGLVYRADLFGKSFLVENGVEGARYDQIAGLSLGPGGIVLFQARSGNVWRVVVGSEERTRYDRVGRPVPGPAGLLAYGACMKGRWTVVVEPRKNPEDPAPRLYERVGEPVFLADGTLAYSARRGDETFAVVGDREFGPFESVLGPIEGPRAVFLFRRSESDWVWDDGREYGPFETAAHPAFGPGGDLYFVVERHGERVLHKGLAHVSEAFDEILSPIVDPASGTIAFSARKGKDRFAVVGSRRLAPCELVEDLAFLPGGEVYYVGRRDKKSFVAISERQGPPYDLVRLVGRSGGDLVYAAVSGRQAFLCRE